MFTMAHLISISAWVLTLHNRYFILSQNNFPFLLIIQTILEISENSKQNRIFIISMKNDMGEAFKSPLLPPLFHQWNVKQWPLSLHNHLNNTGQVESNYNKQERQWSCYKRVSGWMLTEIIDHMMESFILIGWTFEWNCHRQGWSMKWWKVGRHIIIFVCNEISFAFV